MSNALVVGGDRINGIKHALSDYGISKISHWTGRKSGDGRKTIPQNIEMIILVTDWINHSFTSRVKNEAARRGIKIVYTPNSAVNLRSKLAHLNVHLDIEAACRKAITKLVRAKIFKGFKHFPIGFID